jgi:hypothetical protein
VSFLYTVRWLLVKSKRRADARRRRDSLDSFSVCDCWTLRAKSRLTRLTQAHASASRSWGCTFVWLDGPLGRAVSKAAHRLGTRTSPQVARRGLITEAVLFRGLIPRVEGGASTPGPAGRRAGYKEGAPAINGSAGIRRTPPRAEAQRRPVLGSSVRTEGRSVWTTKRSADKHPRKPSPNAPKR